MSELRKVSPLARDAMAYVLAGGRGSRLMEMTDKRAKPAVTLRVQVPHHRLRAVECLELGHPPHRVATQYKAHSLIRHMQRWLELLPP